MRESPVLLKNDGVLRIRPRARVLVAGDGADSIGQASDGWTVIWQGADTTNVDFPGGTSIWAGLHEAVTEAGGVAEQSADGAYAQKSDVGVVVFGEIPYAEFHGDIETLDFGPEEPLALLRRLRAARIPTVSVFLSGRPLWVNPEINASDAFVASWLSGTEGGGSHGGGDPLCPRLEGPALHLPGGNRPRSPRRRSDLSLELRAEIKEAVKPCAGTSPFGGDLIDRAGEIGVVQCMDPKPTASPTQ